MKRPLTDLETLRAQELLVQRATEGLDDDAAAELERAGVADLETFDLAAADVALASVAIEPMPAALADRILATALRTSSTAGSQPDPTAQPSSPTAPAVPAVAAVLPGTTRSELPRIKSSRAHTSPPPRAQAAERAGWGRWALGVGGWAMAAALAVLVWTRATAPDNKREDRRAAAPGVATLPATGGVSVALEAGTDPSGRGVTGEVVWYPAVQRGQLRIQGLAVNDPRVERYQLWIVDGARAPGLAVDGGLFDVASARELVLPIDTRLPLVRPVEVFVTVEAPIGAVVSDRTRVVARATLPTR